MIRTSEFAIAPSVTAARLAQQWLWKRWFLFVVPVAVLLVMGLWDLQWLIVAMMAIFILWPMALFFVWCTTALAPDAVRSSRPHSVVFDERGLVLEYREEEGFSRLNPEIIEWKDVREIEHDGGYMRFVTVAGRSILLPDAAIGKSDMASVVELFRNR
ncbi:MAG: hypothetical protein K2L21_06230 [Muribaculaceae bacterium]|nr:hypothetical protein [Muribaculaceae bacterium]